MKNKTPSVRTFTSLGAGAEHDPETNPTQAAAYWLRRDVVRGVLAPGQRLKVEQLVEFYGVGHSPIREAILRLSGGGLVEHEHQKGYRVAGVSLADYDDVLDVYLRIYELALTMAMERGDEAWEERLVVQLHRSAKVEKVLPDGDPEGRELWQRAYGDLHAAILSGCGSPVLLSLYRDLAGRLERYVNLFGDLTSDRDRDHRRDHKQLVEVILTRDPKRVLPVVRRYFAGAQPIRESIKKALRAPQNARSASAKPEAKAPAKPSKPAGRSKAAPAK